MSFPLLTVTAAVPAVGAIFVAAAPTPRRLVSRWAALGFSLVTLVFACIDVGAFNAGGARFQLTESHPWVSAFGLRYELGVDGIGVILVLLTAVLVPIVMVASWHDADTGVTPAGPLPSGYGENDMARITRRIKAFFALMLAIEAMVIWSFEATDVFLFYLFFEAMLIPMYFLIGGFSDHTKQNDERDPKRSAAAVKFLLYNLIGGLVMLAAVIGLYVATAHSSLGGTFDLPRIMHALATGQLHLDPVAENALFLGFMFAFAIKAPLFPFHSWLPDAMGESTPGVAVLITAVMDKVGVFAMYRYCLNLFPQASKTFTVLIVVLSVISILYGALCAIGSKEIKRLIAYASVSHFGFIILGIFVMTSQGQSGATLYMVNHGLSTAALMLIAGFLISRRGSRMIADFGGVQKTAPILAGTFLISGLAILSLPGLGPFVSEFLVLVGSFSRYPAAGIGAVIGIVLAALYVLILYQRTMTGPVGRGVGAMKDLRVRELVVVAPLIAMMLFLGVYPKPVLDVLNPSVHHTLSAVHRHDPKPQAPAPVVADHGASTTTDGGAK